MDNSLLLLAQAGGGNPLGTLGFMAVLAAIMYFVMIRPQQKQLKEHRSLLAGLKKGDEVVTTGGLLGRVAVVADREVTLEIASGVKVRVLKQAINGKVQTAAEAPAPVKADEKKEEK